MKRLIDPLTPYRTFTGFRPEDFQNIPLLEEAIISFGTYEARRLQLAKEHYNYFFDPGSRPMMSSIVRT